MEQGIHSVWGNEPSWDAPMELGTGNTSKDLSAIKTEWKREYPLIKFHVVLNSIGVLPHSTAKWF